MLKTIFSTTLLLFLSHFQLVAQTTKVTEFEKVIVSPYIQVTFVEGDTESVVVEECTVERSKLYIEVKNKTLWIYLEGAKEIPKGEVMYDYKNPDKYPVYRGTVVRATITYKILKELSIRGEETQLVVSPISADKFVLKIYGESKVVFNQVDFGELQTKLYGDSELEIKSGAIKKQRYTSYGQSKINSLAVKGQTGFITAYGESDFSLNASESIKLTAFGESRLYYKGNPEIVKGLQIGEVRMERL